MTSLYPNQHPVSQSAIGGVELHEADRSSRKKAVPGQRKNLIGSLVCSREITLDSRQHHHPANQMGRRQIHDITALLLANLVDLVVTFFKNNNTKSLLIIVVAWVNTSVLSPKTQQYSKKLCDLWRGEVRWISDCIYYILYTPLY